MSDAATRAAARERPDQAGRAAAGDALRRGRLGVPARRGACELGAAGVGAPRELRAARRGRRRRGVLPARSATRWACTLAVERVALPAAGNLQAEAREARYALAEAARRAATTPRAHTASDQAETVLYRLAVSPGRRALLGMEPRRGRLVRPLLGVTREEMRAYCRAHGL